LGYLDAKVKSNDKNNGNGKSEMRGFFASLRMTRVLGGVEGEPAAASATATATAKAKCGVLRFAQNDKGFGWC
jgi:hypothetical protein